MDPAHQKPVLALIETLAATNGPKRSRSSASETLVTDDVDPPAVQFAE
jgi:hypothetical protein